jgi:hypothetical protein
MHEIILNSGWDAFFLAVPFFLLLVMSVFRLDEAFVTSKRGRAQHRSGGMDHNGDPILCDPDGRPSWKTQDAK